VLSCFASCTLATITAVNSSDEGNNDDDDDDIDAAGAGDGGYAETKQPVVAISSVVGAIAVISLICLLHFIR